MAAAAPAAKKGGLKKAPVNLVTNSAQQDAEAGIVRLTDRKGLVIGQKQKAPYFNKVDGKGTLQLSNTVFSKNRNAKKPKNLVFLRSPRLVGTLEDLRTYLAAHGADPSKWLVAANMVDEANASGAQRDFFEAEVARVKSCHER